MKIPPFRLRDPYGDVLEISVDGKSPYDALRFIRDESRTDAAVLLEVEDVLGLRNWIDQVLNGSQASRLKCGGSRRQQFPNQRKV